AELVVADATAAQDALKTALESLSNIGAGHVDVVASDPAPNYSFAISFDDTVADPQNLMTVTVTDPLTGIGAPLAVTISGTLPDASSVAAAATAAAGSNLSTNGPAVLTAVFNRALLILGDLILEAANPGAWGNSLEVTVDWDTKTDDDGNPDETL